MQMNSRRESGIFSMQSRECAHSREVIGGGRGTRRTSETGGFKLIQGDSSVFMKRGYRDSRRHFIREYFTGFYAFCGESSGDACHSTAPINESARRMCRVLIIGEPDNAQFEINSLCRHQDKYKGPS